MLAAITFSDVLTSIGQSISAVYSMFTSVSGVVTSNMIIFVPVILAFMLTLASAAIVILRKLGVRGLNGGGRRRRRR